MTVSNFVQYGSGSGSVNLYMAHGGSSWGFWSGTPALQTCLLDPDLNPMVAVAWYLKLNHKQRWTGQLSNLTVALCTSRMCILFFLR